MHRSFAHFFLGASAFLSLHLSAQSAVVLTVDISNPNVIVFTATGAASSITDSGVDLTNGFTLEGFFAEEVTKYAATALSPQNLVAHTTTEGVFATYTSTLVVDYASNTSSTGADLRFIGNSAIQNFSTDSAAFLGWAEVDPFFFSSYPLAEIGTVGNILLGSGQANGQGKIIGQFEVIPEPSSLLLVGASAGLIFNRLRRRRDGVLL